MNYDFDQAIARRDKSSLKWDAVKRTAEHQEIIPMWVADMDFTSPPEVIAALKERVEHGVFGYSFRSDSYLESIVSWLNNRHRWTVAEEWIAHSPDVIAALSLIMSTFTEAGDKIVVQSPVYNFARMVEAQGREVVYNPLKFHNGRYEMDYEDLEAKIDSHVKMLILCSPHNPVGRVWEREELVRLGNICRKHHILVVADEIHCDLVYDGHLHIPYASLSEAFANHSFTCISPSKTFNLLSFHASSVIIPNPALREKFNQELNARGISSPNTLGLVALESAYRYGEEWLNQLLHYLQGNARFLVRYAEEHLPEIRVIESEGTYLVWLDCRALHLSVKELDELFADKAEVVLSSGAQFGLEGEGFMRMNIACPRAVLEQALERIADAVRSLRTIEGK
ncbi:MalY/PatB family protein [Paenibacillus lignilyticus]|uniref:cysteine-S-conjugate beta-lyase n=1 Tax=Paenibacillus lignilyticus TaxID=1172615 RepID=A0ABS5CDK3_9BACL|nr:MalY/PatB family protein [Paenibacillus lignilyticus]MBP3964026.1 pyridoxal phosphate-dependent aminotransferase [Paenibacillus lignilyticus]